MKMQTARSMAGSAVAFGIAATLAAQPPADLPFNAAPDGRETRIIGLHGCSLGTPQQRAQAESLFETLEALPTDGSRVIRNTSRNRSGLDIVLDLSPAVAADADAVAAIERAVARWEALVPNQLTVLYSVDFTSNQSFVAAATASLFVVSPYESVRAAIVAQADSVTLDYISAIPTTVPDFAYNSGIAANRPWSATRAEIKTWGGFDPNDTSSADGSIVLNTDFTFDTDLSDGVTPGTVDLEGVMVHELGHVFGFRSGLDTQARFTALDLFRFGDGVNSPNPDALSDISNRAFGRELRDGVPAALDSVGAVPPITEDFPFSTGRFGDGRQGSHWKDDALLGTDPVGVMDPTAPIDSLAEIGFFTDADRLAFRLIGLDIEFLSSCETDLTSTNTNPGDEGYGEPDGISNGNDLTYYVEFWLAGSLVADFSTTNTNPGEAGYGEPDGTVDGIDLSYFVETWLAGCS